MKRRHLVVAGCIACASLAACAEASPPQQQLGFATKLVDLHPTKAMVSPDGTGKHALYPQTYWQRQIPISPRQFSDSMRGLTIPLNSHVTTITKGSQPGSVPLIEAWKGFYVEFETAITDNDPDHWPAVWLMPIEHDIRKTDRVSNEDPQRERWIEIDVDEGGFSPGTHGVLLDWSGIWPNYQKTPYGPGSSIFPVDRTKFHRFGFSYEPVSKTATWWFDGKPTAGYKIPFFPKMKYYPIFSAQSHGKGVPYKMFVRHISAYGPK